MKAGLRESHLLAPSDRGGDFTQPSLCLLSQFCEVFWYLQIVKVGSAANRYLRWRVGFIEFEVGVDLDVADRGLSLELDVDQVWELPV